MSDNVGKTVKKVYFKVFSEILQKELSLKVYMKNDIIFKIQYYNKSVFI